jgi:hypothetical protein
MQSKFISKLKSRMMVSEFFESFNNINNWANNIRPKLIN